VDEISGNGNGRTGPLDVLDEEEKSAYIALKDRQREDTSIATMGKVAQGVINTTLSFSDDLNQALMLGDIESYEERDDLIGAIRECRLTGCSVDSIRTYLAASCGTNKRGRWNNRVAQAYDAISHTKFTTNQRSPSGKGSSRGSISD
jgi:hypothetical protein